MTDAMRKRVRAVHAQAAIRRFEYRQRDLAKGTWPKIRRLLALTERAFALSEEAAAALEAEGRSPEPEGLALHPIRRLYVIRPEDLDELAIAPDAERRVSLDSVLSEARLALLPFRSA